MTWIPSPTAITLAGISLFSLDSSSAEITDDGSALIEFRNFYLNRNLVNSDAPRDKAEEWAQGAVVRLNSGYSSGSVGLGIEALGMVGIRLDSSAAKSGTGLLPVDSAGRASKEYSELGVTGKIKVSQTELRIGTLQPNLPVIGITDVRLLPSSFEGQLLTSNDIDSLTIHTGHIDKQNSRDSSNSQPISSSGVESPGFKFIGGNYKLTSQLGVSYYYAEMTDIYRQSFFGLLSNTPTTGGFNLHSDLRYFTTKSSGAEKLKSPNRVDDGQLDNEFFNAMLTLGKSGHRVGLGYQSIQGEGNFAFPEITPYSMNMGTVDLYVRAGTVAWQARYDYDFAAVGIPGLSLMTRYIKGQNIRTLTTSDGTAWERDTDLTYVIQSGPLKNVYARYRNGTYREGNGLTAKINENRLILGYTVLLW